MATDEMTDEQKAASRFGWSGTGQIRMLDSDGKPLSAREVESVNAVLAYRAWAEANPEEAAAEADDEDDPLASTPAGRL